MKYLLFAPRFVGPIVARTKRQTIRGTRRCEPGDVVSLRRWTVGGATGVTWCDNTVLQFGEYLDMIYGPARGAVNTPADHFTTATLLGGTAMPQQATSAPAPGQFASYFAGLSGRALGVFKKNAASHGLTLDEYAARLDSGQKFCNDCKRWLDATAFKPDRTRWDGTARRCAECNNARNRERYAPVPPEERKPMGPPREDPRDGDKLQARHLINLDIRRGDRPSPNDLHCVFCGHKGDDRRHEYHHLMGYSERHHYDVVPVCTACHAKQEAKANAGHCLRGHAYTPENTIRRPNGTRQCRECRKEHDRKRRDAALWREYRAKRAAEARPVRRRTEGATIDG